jgi:hypothetical protein
MKNIIFCIAALIILGSCKSRPDQTNNEDLIESNTEYISFGEKFTPNDALTASDMMAKYNEMSEGDSLHLKMTAMVDEVCQMKGCWMKLNLEEGTQVMVRFKDYGFFVPKDIAGKKVVVNGKAFIKETSVDEQHHYAEDAGKSEDDIAAITEAKKTLTFEADGVLLKQ